MQNRSSIQYLKAYEWFQFQLSKKMKALFENKQRNNFVIKQEISEKTSGLIWWRGYNQNDSTVPVDRQRTKEVKLRYKITLVEVGKI